MIHLYTYNIRNPLKSIFIIAVGITLFLTSGCSRSHDQIEFEQQAYRIPSNFTETTPDGRVVQTDENDWQIGPMFQGFVEVEVPPFPNPTHGEHVRIELLITEVGTVNGLHAVGYYDMFDDRTQRTLYRHHKSPLDFGLLVFTINPAYFGYRNNYNSARQVNNGLHRLFIYDNRFNLITYGDIQLK